MPCISLPTMGTESRATDLDHQLHHAEGTREFAYSILQGEHKDNFERKDYIGFGLFNRCLQTHESIEHLVRKPMLDDAWILTRALVEHAVNSAYMFYVADSRTADDFADYPPFQQFEVMQGLKGADDRLFQQLYSPEDAAQIQKRFEAVKARFQDRRGDRWCDDDRLYKRARRVDQKISEAMGETHCDFLWLVNSVWRHGGAYVHGTAGALVDQVSETADGVKIQRKYTREEAAQIVFSANLAFFLILLLVELRLGQGNVQEIKRQFTAWGG